MIHFVFYTNLFVGANHGAETYGPFIFIRPEHKGKVALLEHEKVHVKQFWRNPLFGIAYILSKKARLGYEAEAYREQLKYDPGKEEVFSGFLVNNYNLGITKEEALAALKGE